MHGLTGLTGGSWKRSRHSVTATEKNNLTRNRVVPNGSVVYNRTTPPRQFPTLHRGVVSSQTFDALDDYLWRLTYRWALRRHPNKPRKWIKARYFGRFHPTRQDNWVFADRSSGAYLHRFSWTRIVRHQLVTGTAAPDDLP